MEHPGVRFFFFFMGEGNGVVIWHELLFDHFRLGAGLDQNVVKKIYRPFVKNSQANRQTMRIQKI